MHDLISLRDLSKDNILEYLYLAQEMEKNLYSKYDLHKGKLFSTMFFEPSTRTNLSFQSAAQRLGMACIPYSHELSSSKKGESLQDTIKIIDGYADAIAIRHPSEGSARLAADVASAPVINAGDGSNQHPTQTLIDLYAIKKAKGKFEGLNVSLVGDLKFGRTTRSLSYALAMLGANINLISVPGLEMDAALTLELEEKFGAKISVCKTFDISDADVLYMTRIQAERFEDKYLAKKLQENYSLGKQTLKGAKEGMIIMHPLPRLSEIPQEIDSSPHAYYFEQAKCGVPVRMAVLHHCLSK